MMAFILWMVFGCMIVIFGISAFWAKKEFGFWANVKPLPMRDIKGYNRAVGKLFITVGILLILLGLPLLAGQNSPWVIMSILGAMLVSIGAMIVYMLVIQPKYEKK